MKVKSRPLINLSSETLEVFKKEAFLNNKSLSDYLANLIIIGYQTQNNLNN